MAKAYENYQPPYDDINEPNVKNTLERDIAYTKDEIVEIDERIARLEVRQREAVANGDPRAGDIGRTIQSQEEYKIRRQRQIDGATRDLETVTQRELPQQPDTGDVSSGAIVDNEALAKKEGAGTQTPYPDHLGSPPGETVVEGNADTVEIREKAAEEGNLNPLTDGVKENISSANSDDKAETVSVVGGTNFVNFEQAFEQAFDPSDNPTTKYAQLTYNIGLYLASPEQYNRIRAEGKKTTQGLSKILQSGGNNVKEDAIFPDIFIDDLEIQGLMPAANQGPHNVLTMSFKIIEPMGYTFLTKLKKLCADNGLKDFVRQHYIMVIKYKGFDENGKQVSDEMDDRMTKFVPFMFQKINSKVATGAITYDCQAIAINHGIALSAKRATVPFNVEVLGQSMEDLFNAKSPETRRGIDATVIEESVYDYPQAFGGRPKPGKVTPGILRDSAGGSAITKGIIVELNKQANKLKTKGQFEQADRYRVTFKGDIGKQRIIAGVAEKAFKNRTAMNQSSGRSANSLLNNTSMDKTRQLFSIPAGQQIPQLIDLLLRASEWTQKQQKWIINPDGTQTQSTDYSKSLKWWHVGVNVSPIAWDEKRGDYAYEIEYVVSPRKGGETYSPYFNKSEFTGVHKAYNYWFTGDNTEILDYQQDLNASYFVEVDGKIPLDKQEFGPEKENSTPKSFVNQDTTALGQPGETSTPAEMAASVIYSTVDFATFQMTVLGDPDYIMQNDIMYDSGNTFGAFMPDGSINYDSQDVLVGVNFRTMEDYDAVTGGAILLDPLFTDGTEATRGLIYKLTHVNSLFSQGKMTQTMRGVLREFPKKDNETKDAGREKATQQSTVTKKRKSNIGKSNPPGNTAITDGAPTGPNFTPISVAQNSQGQFDTAGPIGPNFNNN